MLDFVEGHSFTAILISTKVDKTGNHGSKGFLSHIFTLPLKLSLFTANGKQPWEKGELTGRAKDVLAVLKQ